MDLWKSLVGMVRVEIICADISGFLSMAAEENVPLYEIEEIDPLTVQITIRRQDLKVIKKLIDRTGGEQHPIRKLGFFWRSVAILRRPVLMIGIICLLLSVLYLPGRIFFIKVEGNELLPDRLIIEKAEESGICFGTSRRAVRSEKVKNALLSAMPELQWAGVNTSGCVATICVREKTISDISSQSSGTVSSIIASRDGVIVSSTVLKGNPLCWVGQAVKEGQILVSGYTDCGITIQATRADAEILAQTQRFINAVTPLQGVKRDAVVQEETKYSLLVGKKLIKFYKDSGISHATCVKMYLEEYLTLPGGFQLPVALVTERWISYDTSVQQMDEPDWLKKVASTYMQTQMVAGQILNEETTIDMQDGFCTLRGTYSCLEMIGQVKNEEILYSYGEEHGENR